MMVKPRLYNPALLSKDELKDTFIARKETFDELIGHIAKHKPDEPCRHLIIVGARGMGKTTLGLRVLYEIEDNPTLSDTWQPVPFNEESYGISDAADLWLTALDHLSYAVDDGVWSEYSKKIAQSEPDSARLEAYALDALNEYCEETGKRVLLFVENIDHIFEQFKSKREAHAIRAAIMTNPKLLLVGTANSAFRGIKRYSDPFYGFFQLFRLEGLSRYEAEQLVEAIVKRSTGGEHNVDLSLAQGRMEAIRRLTGGNPRSISMAAQMLIEVSSERTDVLERLIDEQTPYFKARIEDLPVQARKVFDQLADGWRPMLAREVAVRSRLGTSQASAQLRVLIDRGYVKEVNLVGESRTRYELCDRFFNIYYLYRLSKAKREKLRQFVEFLYDLFGALSVGILYAESLRIFGAKQYTLPETGELLSALASKIIREEELAGQEGCISEILRVIGKSDEQCGKGEEQEPPGTSDWVTLGKRLHISGRVVDTIKVYSHALRVVSSCAGGNDESDWLLVKEILDHVNSDIDLDQISTPHRLEFGCMIALIGTYGTLAAENSLAEDTLSCALRCADIDVFESGAEHELNVVLVAILLEMIARKPRLGKRSQREEIIERITKIARSDDESLFESLFQNLMFVVYEMVLNDECDSLRRALLWATREFPEKDEGWRIYAGWELLQIRDDGRENAKKCVKEALMIGPDDPYNHYIAFAVYAGEEWIKALEHLERCFELDPKVAKIRRSALAKLLLYAACAGQEGKVREIIENANLKNELEPLWYALQPEIELDALPLPREIVDAAKHIRSKLGNETQREH